jgi:D-Tyr-tRNAtyr deacylase
MTVQSDLQKAVASAESAKGTYASFAQSTEDQTAKQMFQSMTQDMDRHIAQLNSRLGVTAQNLNLLNNNAQEQED